MFKHLFKFLAKLPSTIAVKISAMEVGDTVKLYGGYDYEPKWLGKEDHRLATVLKFIPGQDTEPAAVVKLSQPITVDSVTGEVLVLELRHEGTKWFKKGTVHIELCNFIPEDIRWQDRKQGLWVEAAASYAVQ